MAEPNGTRLWVKILGPLIPLILSGAIAYGVLKSEAEGLRRDVDLKAPREVVDAQYQALLREIQALRADISDLKRRP